ncbi:MAG: urea amidolyase [Pseudomonadota bacterium]
MRRVTVQTAGPAMSVQDMGRPGYRARGLTIGGAADRTAIIEGAALLGQSPALAAIEMGGSGGVFVFEEDTRIALTGAVMSATLDDAPLQWDASHFAAAGATLKLGGARTGSYGYLHLGGGCDVPAVMGARGSHLAGGIGALLYSGEVIGIGPDPYDQVGMAFEPDGRLGGGEVRVVASMQTADFDPATISRFGQTRFRRDARANRMGVRLDFDGPGFGTASQLSIVSEVVVPGDIQIAGDGAPYVLMYECQTTGGYPRIGTVLPCDLPRVAQAQAGETLRFTFVEEAEAIALQVRHRAALIDIRNRTFPLVRDPAQMRDLLRYQLISGAISATSAPQDLESAG